MAHSWGVERRSGQRWAEPSSWPTGEAAVSRSVAAANSKTTPTCYCLIGPFIAQPERAVHQSGVALLRTIWGRASRSWTYRSERPDLLMKEPLLVRAFM